MHKSFLVSARICINMNTQYPCALRTSCLGNSYNCIWEIVADSCD